MHASLLLPAALLLAGVSLLPAGSGGSAPAAGPDASWKVDPAHTTVGFRVKHMNASWFHGRFNQCSGTIVWDPQAPAASSIEFEIAAASVDTNNQDRDDHLRNADFLNAKVHPKLAFRSTEVAAAGKDKLKVKGTLSLHGVERAIELDVDYTGAGTAPWGELIGFETEFTVKRGDFGITAYPGALGEEVRVHVAIEAIKQ